MSEERRCFSRGQSGSEEARRTMQWRRGGVIVSRAQLLGAIDHGGVRHRAGCGAGCAEGSCADLLRQDGLLRQILPERLPPEDLVRMRDDSGHFYDEAGMVQWSQSEAIRAITVGEVVPYLLSPSGKRSRRRSTRRPWTRSAAVRPARFNRPALLKHPCQSTFPPLGLRVDPASIRGRVESQ